MTTEKDCDFVTFDFIFHQINLTIGKVECVLKSNSTFLEASFERTDDATRFILLMVIRVEISSRSWG